MTQTEQKSSNQRVTNAKIFAKLEEIEGQLEKLDPVCEHVIKCAERWKAHWPVHAALDADIRNAQSNKGWLAALGVSVTAGVAAIGAWLKQ